MGSPKGQGGPDYTRFPDRAYFLDLTDISKPGDSPLLEVPLTVQRPDQRIAKFLHQLVRRAPRLLRAAVNRLYPAVAQLRPQKGNLRELLGILKQAKRQGRDYVEFMLHSSEFMPGGSPNFRTDSDIETLYGDLEELFSVARAEGFQGSTLSDYRKAFVESRGPVHPREKATLLP